MIACARAGYRLGRPAAVLMMAMLLSLLVPMRAHAQAEDDLKALNRQAAQLYAQGRYAEGTEVAQQALTLAERVLGKEHRGTLAIINNLATLYYAQGRYALEARERVLGKQHPDTLASVNTLAKLRRAQARQGSPR
jgi:hypothetical protein